MLFFMVAARVLHIEEEYCIGCGSCFLPRVGTNEVCRTSVGNRRHHAGPGLGRLAVVLALKMLQTFCIR